MWHNTKLADIELCMKIQAKIILHCKGRSRVSSKSSRTQSEVMSHKKKSIKNSFLFQGKYNELHLFIVCLFSLKYAHKKSYTSRFSDQAKCLRKNIANSTRCAHWPIIISSF